MKSGIWRLASVGLLSLAIAGQALAEGQGADHHGGQGQQWQGRPQGNGGGQMQGRPQENQGGQWQGRPQEHQGGQWQGRPQGNQGWQWQGRPQGNQGGQWQGRPQENERAQFNQGAQWQSRPQGNFASEWQGRWHGDQGQWHPSEHGGNWGPHPSDWRPGHVVDRVPPGHYRVPWRGSDYFFSEGYWYRPYGSRYVMVAPPYGVRVSYLPDFAEQVWIGSMLYFLAAGTYYLFYASAQTYEVVPPPQVQQAPLANPYDVIAYPAYGQSPEQQARDHYECHAWAVGQSGFDPAMVTYAQPQQAVDGYRGALAACLRGRGYSVN
jgi:hypothetical protein